MTKFLGQAKEKAQNEYGSQLIEKSGSQLIEKSCELEDFVVLLHMTAARSHSE